MTKDEFVLIKNKIEKAEAESLKASGTMEAIEKRWKDEFGLENKEQVSERIKQLDEEIAVEQEKQGQLIEKLDSSFDWSLL